MGLLEELRNKAARGEVLTSGEMMDITEEFERLEAKCRALENKLDQKTAQIAILDVMMTSAMGAAGSCRTVDEMRELTKNVAVCESPLFNSFEVRTVISELDFTKRCEDTLQKDYTRLSKYVNEPIGVQAVIAAVDAGEVRPFSFQDVAALVDAQRSANTLSRPVRNSVREVFQLLKAQPNALFYGQEVKMVREWGTNHDRNLSIVKARLGRAFTDPVGYMDDRFDMMLSKTTKRQLLDGKALLANAYQNAVFTRPDFLKIPEDWKLTDGRTQFHAGPFHTHPDSGKWWSGTHFTNLTAAELMNTLETALGELRLLYIHFPNGVQNEATES